MKLYKLTDQTGYTRRGMDGETLWEEGTTHQATEEGNTLCTAQVIHAYRDPLLALFMNPIHANLTDPVVWEAEASEIVADDGTKVGVKELTTIKKLEIAPPTIEQRVRFAILVALAVYPEPKFQEWGKKWLSGEDRTEAAARAARAAEAAAWAAAEAAWAAWAAAEAARAAERSLDLIPLAHKAMEES